MKSLFIKIFFWFWLAMILVIAALAISVVGTSRRLPPPNPEELVALTLETVGQTSLETLSRDGPSEAHEFIQRISSPDGTRFSVFSPEHPDLSVDRAPGRVRRLVEEARDDDALHRSADGESFIYAKCVRSDDATVVVVFEAPQFEGLLESAGNPRALGLRVAAVVLVGGLVCYWLARSITAPLRRLMFAASHLARGDLTARVGPELGGRGDELAELGLAFDRMADKIEALVTAQQRLLQDVSHELRSPLARLNVALALARKQAPADATDLLDRIEREGERMNRLIGQLLTLARFESKSEELPKKVDLEALMATIVQDAQFEADSRRVSVQIVKSQACFVLGHSDLLYAAIQNVVRNAVRYTDEGSSVEISLEWTESKPSPEVRIRVRDHGPGVPESELSSILQPFYSVDGGLGCRDQATGIGLSIVDRVVRQLGGRVSLSNATDGGLIFDIYLPRSDESCGITTARLNNG
jgi:two-component system sensor histidine kinase CpxA